MFWKRRSSCRKYRFASLYDSPIRFWPEYKISSVIHALLSNFFISKISAVAYLSFHYCELRNISFEPTSGAAKYIFSVKLDNFGVPSTSHGDKLPRTPQFLTRYKWNLVSWVSHLLPSDFPKYPSHYYLQMWFERLLLSWEVRRSLFSFSQC
jgi:hypothetical protein